MNKFVFCFVIMLTLISISQPCHAAKVNAYVNRFTVSVAENKEELKSSLQTLLMSRLNNDDIKAVENRSDAAIQIEGSYIVFGTVFSLDALLKTSEGVFIDRVFIQGDTDNQLIPSVTEMATQLHRAILKWNPALATKTAGDTAVSAVEKVPLIKVKKEVGPESKPVRTTKAVKLAEKAWDSHRLPEPLTGIAVGRTIINKGIELFITGERYLRYYLKADKLQFISAVSFAADEKIISVDVADLDQNGVPEVYVTILKNGQPASQVYIPDNNELKKIAENLPYMLRSIGLEGKDKKIFAQKILASGNFSGDVYELVKSGDNFTAKEALQMPLFGNLYNFNKFIDSKGNKFFIVGHPDGYLLVYSNEKKQLWKSRDKFGGSEPLCQAENNDSSSPLNVACNFSVPQRLLVTKAGDLVVSRNSRSGGKSDARSYSKNIVMQLFWDGVSFQEKWRTAQSNNYLADFSYDERIKELTLLEVEPQNDLKDERGSKVVVKQLE